MENSSENNKLFDACEYNDIEKVKFLFEQKGANINEKNEYGMTALHLASRYGNLEIVKYLVEKGANINEKNERGLTAFWFASRNSHLEIVKYLIEKGANINEKDEDGMTALLFASRYYHHSETVRYLIEKSADLWLKTKNTQKYAIDFIDNDESLKMLMKNKMKIQKFQKFQYTTILRFNRLLMPQIDNTIYKRVLFHLILGYINEIK